MKKLSSFGSGPNNTACQYAARLDTNDQWRSWPGARPPEPPGIVHVNSANPMTISSGGGGEGWVGCRVGL